MVVNLLHPFEKPVIQAHIQAVFSEFGRNLLRDFLHPRVGFCLQQVEKQGFHPAEIPAGIFQREYRVPEIRFTRVVNYGVHLRLRGGYGRPERREVVLLTEKVETWSSERRIRSREYSIVIQFIHNILHQGPP